MPRVEREIEIGVRPEEVFAFAEEPTNLPEIWPSLLEVTDVARMANDGPTFHYVFKMAGMRFQGTSETVEFEPNRRHAVHNTDGRHDGLEATIPWMFAPEGDGTKLHLEAEYRIPGLLGRLGEPIIARQTEREVEVVLANLKERLKH